MPERLGDVLEMATLAKEVSNMRDDRPDHGATPEDSNGDSLRWIEDPNWSPGWPAQYAREAGGQWNAAHRRLIAKLRAEGAQYINRKLDNLRTQLGVPHNGWTFNRTQGPAQVVLAAQDALKRLQLRAQANRTDRQRLHDLPSLASPVSEGPRKPTTQEWWKLSAILGVCIAIEAVANSYLLASALTTGLVGAFITAIVISFLNVGALGAGIGLLLSALRRRTAQNGLFYGCVAAWGAAALLLNLLVGRHREAFARLIDAREEQMSAAIETNMATATEMASTIPYIPSSWQFESLLFFCLGIALCVFGFFKGYTFIGAGDPHHARRELDNEKAAILSEYHSLSERYRERLTQDLRASVAGWVETLDQAWQNAINEQEDLKANWSGGSLLARVEALFIAAYNDSHATKIDQALLDEHREQADIDISFPATPADEQVPNDARDIIRKWTDTDQKAFFEAIHVQTKEIDRIWTDYRPLIVDELAGTEQS